MRKILLYIFLMTLPLAYVGCDVHELPEECDDQVPFLLHLDFNTEMPLYKEVQYTRSGDALTSEAATQHDIRYIINAYRIDNMRSDSREADATFVFTKSDLSDLNYTAHLSLPEGTYDFRVWADYVDSGSIEDKYYDTSNFSEIILADREHHSGSNDYRDAFRGYATATVTNPAYYTGSIVNTIDNQATAEMRRPMGKFKFVTTDVEIYLTRVIQMMKDQGVPVRSEEFSDSQAMYDQLVRSLVLNDYYVVFRYNIFMPCSFNMFTDKPADSWTGMSFSSRMFADNTKELTLGYDYIFVNGAETTLSLSVEIYNNEDKLVSSTDPIDVPIARSKMTLVKGEFLMSKATGGVTINPSYDGDDYNIEIF